MKITINTNTELVHKINKSLQNNLEKYGAMYCPCSLIHDKDHVCPCKEFMESSEEGSCHCGKFIKTEG